MQPDLSPCDFFVFPKIKKALAGKKYNRLEILFRAVQAVVNSMSQEEYHKSFESWRKRLQRCIDVEGDYFEGLT
jgi:histone-lysine N-methyltransferase SETMAR